MSGVADKASLRRTMRMLRNELSDRRERSVRIWEQVLAIDGVATASNVLAFNAIPGEPDTMSFVERCRSAGRTVAFPEDGVAPTWPDVVIVPGLAFSRDGHRLGQGGGWYDRFLAERRQDCVTIGVCFAPQLLDDLPTEAHDVIVDHVVTD